MKKDINDYIIFTNKINNESFYTEEYINNFKTENILDNFYLKRENYIKKYKLDYKDNKSEYMVYIYDLLLEAKTIENKLNSINIEKNINKKVQIIKKIENFIKDYYKKNNDFEFNSLNLYESIENVIINEYNDVFNYKNKEENIFKNDLENNKETENVVFFDNFKIQEISYKSNDHSIYIKYRSKNEWIYPRNNILEVRRIIDESKNNIIKMKLKSHSNILNEIKEKIKYLNYEINEPLRIIDKIIEYKNLLKSKNVDIIKLIKTSKTFEKIEDEIDLCIKNSKIEKFIKSIISSKYKHLIKEENHDKKEKYTDLNKETFKLCYSLIDENVTTEDLQNFIGKKIARYKTTEDLNAALKIILMTFNGFNESNIMEKIKKENLNVEIIESKDNILLLKINDFKASKMLGSSSWCISNYESLFLDYTQNKDQYFLFDFNKMPEDIESMIGYTYKDGKIHNTHLKNDNYNKNDVLMNNFLNIIKTKEENNKIKKSHKLNL